MNNKLRTALIIFFSGILCLSLFMIIKNLIEYKKGEDIIKEAQSAFVKDVTSSPVVATTVSTDPLGQNGDDPAEENPGGDGFGNERDVKSAPGIEVDFEGLKRVNGDIIGWILIEDTVVNYPLLQGVDNQKYVTTAYNGSYSRLGSIFVDYRNDPSFKDPNTIIYGHNMKNPSMFHYLPKYVEQSYYEEHPTFFIITEDGYFPYEVFSAYKTTMTSDSYTVSFPESADFENYLDMCVKNSRIDTGIVPTKNDLIITLSTCAYGGGEGRYVVHARQVYDEIKLLDTGK